MIELEAIRRIVCFAFCLRCEVLCMYLQFGKPRKEDLRVDLSTCLTITSYLNSNDDLPAEASLSTRCLAPAQ